jgi:hypothetical protein
MSGQESAGVAVNCHKLSVFVGTASGFDHSDSLVVDALFLFSPDNNFVTTIFLIFQQESLVHRIPA